MLSKNSYTGRSKRSDSTKSNTTTTSFISSDFGPSVNTSLASEVSISTLKCEQDEIPFAFYNKNTRTFTIDFKKQKSLADEIVKYTKKRNIKSFVTLQLGNNENIKVTSLLLSHASSLIERILLKKKDKVCCINAKLFSPSHVKNIINFLKTGKIVFKMEDLPQLFAILHRFEMSSICALFEASLLSCVNSHKSLLTTMLNFISDSKNLISTNAKAKLLEMVNYRFNDFILGQHFFDLAPSALILVLSSDMLKIRNEIDIMRIAVIFMDKVDCFGYADSIFNCIRFNYCNQEMLQSMKNELIKYGNKHLLFVFDCFNPDLDQSLIKHMKQPPKHVFQKNLNYLVKRDNGIKNLSSFSNSLAQMMDGLISEATKERNDALKVSGIQNSKKNFDNSLKPPQKFKIMPGTPKSLKKLRKSKLNDVEKKPTNFQQNSFVESLTSNPYKTLPNYNHRLFSADSIFDINKHQNAFDYNFNGDLLSQPFPHFKNENIQKSSIEKNPYYYAFKDREQRKFTPESFYEIKCLTKKFTDNDNRSNTSKSFSSQKSGKQNLSLNSTQYSSKSTKTPVSFVGKSFKVQLPQYNEYLN
ncbi:BTB/POZ-like domain and BTB/POZ fold domain and BTB/Kelch-associated domain and BTB/POZ domain-containing protein [Strongyloides ratti]|uniref:BTB/POZ-like domain and BTB/POZ fold domain and BTB/Kelch-associated domain and BTB/POZ domain-containing protein n=1 Tax=Strongyloides ratti TaxID=34506 RepID=A0A090L0F3_STRRB|nr:BTB/POZ-like domain and BTB/POZ fold domain and BTB/Kelch-associated domain and BTB/POZ domain-containing protein [Strongyloides ratti]CEF63225.1 BTB/POZ-like domain and BTB/POZ fold domain and BTB/Kelch-associated domain and BTB/POZ domain-containing protein [Strongyloides ratti]